MTKVESLIFIDAPDYPNEEAFYDTILNCFKKIGITFKRSLYLGKNASKKEYMNFDKTNCVYFLMGGNPITQRKIIDTLELNSVLKGFDGLVIGFCAGAINLSKYSIITTDEDFPTAQSYIGLGRVDITIEPHYNRTETKEELDRRHTELNDFCSKYNTEILAVPDSSIIIVEDGNIKEYGEIYKFKNR